MRAFLTRIIGRIIVQSEFTIKFLAFQHTRYKVPGKPHMNRNKKGRERITKNCHLSKYFCKIELNFAYGNYYIVST